MFSCLLSLACVFAMPSLEVDLPVSLGNGIVDLHDQREIPKSATCPITVGRRYSYEKSDYTLTLCSRLYAFSHQEKDVGKVFEVELDGYGKVRYVMDSEHTYKPYFGQEFQREGNGLSGLTHPDNVHVTEGGKFIILTYFNLRKLVYEEIETKKMCGCGRVHYILVKEYDGLGNITHYEYDNSKLISHVVKKDAEENQLSKILFRREWKKKGYDLIVQSDGPSRNYSFDYVNGGYRFASLKIDGIVADAAFYEKEAPYRLSYWKDLIKGGYGFFFSRGRVALFTKPGFNKKNQYNIRYNESVVTLVKNSNKIAFYEYDDYWRLVSIKRGSYRQEQSYTPCGVLKKKQFFEGEKVLYEREYFYDVFHNITKIQETIDGVCKECSYFYDDKCRLIREVSEKGIEKRHEYKGSSLQVLLTEEFDGENLTERISYEYDKVNRLVKEERSDGGPLDRIYCKITSYEYDGDKRSGIYFSYKEKESDFEKRLWGHAYEYSESKLVRVSKLDDHKAVIGESSYEYLRGSLKKEVSLSGEEICYKYDPQKRVTQVIRDDITTVMEYKDGYKPAVIEDDIRSGEVFKTLYSYDAEGAVLSKKCEEKGENEVYSYDNLGRLIKTKKGSCSYDVLNRVIREVSLGSVTCYSYLGGKDPVHVTYPDGTTSFKKQIDEEGLIFLCKAKDGVESKRTFDRKGNLIEEECGDKRYLYRYKGNLLIEEMGPEGRQISYTYDGAGRLVKEEGSSSAEIKYDNFSRVIYRKRNGRVESFEYDSADRVLKETICGKETSYYYDAVGNRHVNGFPVVKYDGYKRAVSLVNFDGTKEEYTYGIRNKKTLYSSGKEKIEKFDSLGRLLSLEFFNKDKTLESLETFKYNKQGALVYRKGESFSPHPVSKEIHYTYDKSGRHLLKENDTEFFYNDNWQLLKKIKGDGVSLCYAYDEYGRVNKINASDGSINYEISYDLLDRIIFVKDNIRGVNVDREYDSSGNLLKEWFVDDQKIKLSYKKGKRKSLLFSDGSMLCYQYFPNGSLLSIDRYAKDGLYQYSHTYEYDSKKNIISQTHPFKVFSTRHFYNEGGRCILTQSPYKKQEITLDNKHKEDPRYTPDKCLFDKLGRVTFDGKIAYFYDALDRVVETRDVRTHEKCKYLYDYFGRLRKTSSNESRYFIYDGEHEIGSFSKNGFYERAVIHPISAKIVAIEKGPKVYIPIYDLFDNIVSIVDSSTRQVCEKYEIAPFGEEKLYHEECLNPWRYKGKRKLSESFFLFGERSYSLKQRMFLTKDPLLQDFCYSPYRFCKDNPLLFSDEDGLSATKLPPLIRGRLDEAFTFPDSRDTFLYFVNGLDTTREYLTDCTDQMQNLFDQSLTPYYRSCKDSFFGVIAEFLGSTSKARNLARQIKLDLQDNKGDVVVFGHSAGGSTIRKALSLLDKNECKRVEVYTYGSAALVTTKHLKSSTNYYSTRDYLMSSLVRLLQPTKSFGNMQFTPSLVKGGVMDHSLMDDTYRKRWEKDLSALKVY